MSFRLYTYRLKSCRSSISIPLSLVTMGTAHLDALSTHYILVTHFADPCCWAVSQRIKTHPKVSYYVKLSECSWTITYIYMWLQYEGGLPNPWYKDPYEGPYIVDSTTPHLHVLYTWTMQPFSNDECVMVVISPWSVTVLTWNLLIHEFCELAVLVVMRVKERETVCSSLNRSLGLGQERRRFLHLLILLVCLCVYILCVYTCMCEKQ